MSVIVVYRSHGRQKCRPYTGHTILQGPDSSGPFYRDGDFYDVHSGQPISRFLSLDGHLSGSVITHAVVQSTRRFLRDGPPQCACLTLLPVRFTSRRHYCLRWWSLTPPFHPYRCSQSVDHKQRRSAFCCTFCRVAPPGCSPVPCPVESGLSSEADAYRVCLAYTICPLPRPSG